jgi:predicted metallopeptidase
MGAITLLYIPLEDIYVISSMGAKYKCIAKIRLVLILMGAVYAFT